MIIGLVEIKPIRSLSSKKYLDSVPIPRIRSLSSKKYHDSIPVPMNSPSVHNVHTVHNVHILSLSLPMNTDGHYAKEYGLDGLHGQSIRPGIWN